jgi:hypothetical protein
MLNTNSRLPPVSTCETVKTHAIPLLSAIVGMACIVLSQYAQDAAFQWIGFGFGATMLLYSFYGVYERSGGKHGDKLCYIAGLLACAAFAYFHGGVEGLAMGGVGLFALTAAMGFYKFFERDQEKSYSPFKNALYLGCALLASGSLIFTHGGWTDLTPLLAFGAFTGLAAYEISKKKEGKTTFAGPLLGGTTLFLLAQTLGFGATTLHFDATAYFYTSLSAGALLTASLWLHGQDKKKELAHEQH